MFLANGQLMEMVVQEHLECPDLPSLTCSLYSTSGPWVVPMAAIPLPQCQHVPY